MLGLIFNYCPKVVIFSVDGYAKVKGINISLFPSFNPNHLKPPIIIDDYPKLTNIEPQAEGKLVIEKDGGWAKPTDDKPSLYVSLERNISVQWSTSDFDDLYDKSEHLINYQNTNDEGSWNYKINENENGNEPEKEPQEKKCNVGLIIGVTIAAIVVVAIIIVVIFFVIHQKNTDRSLSDKEGGFN